MVRRSAKQQQREQTANMKVRAAIGEIDREFFHLPAGIALELAKLIRDRLGEWELSAVSNARDPEGMSWDEIAGVFGQTRQSVHRKYHKARKVD